MIRYVHEIKPSIDWLYEKERVYEILRKKLPNGEEINHDFRCSSRVHRDFTEEEKRTIPSHIQIIQLMVGGGSTDDWICSIESYVGSITSRETLVRITYDTREKNRLVIETTRFSDPELGDILF